LRIENYFILSSNIFYQKNRKWWWKFRAKRGSESATDAAAREQRELALFVEPRGGKACGAGLT
jgi:hypothetical protein